MLPVRSNNAGPCGPRYQSRACQPIGVGSRAGSSAAAGAGAVAPFGSSLARVAGRSTTPCRPWRSASHTGSAASAAFGCCAPLRRPPLQVGDRRWPQNVSSHRLASSARAVATSRSASQDRPRRPRPGQGRPARPPRGTDRTGRTTSRRGGGRESCALCGEHHQHPRRDASPCRRSSCPHVDQLRAQPRLVRGQLRAGRRCRRAASARSAASPRFYAATRRRHRPRPRRSRGPVPAAVAAAAQHRRRRRCCTGNSGAGTTNTVRRMPSIRTIAREPYSASSTASTVAAGDARPAPTGTP